MTKPEKVLTAWTAYCIKRYANMNSQKAVNILILLGLVMITNLFHLLSNRVQAQTTLPERVAQVESRQGSLQSQIDRNNADINILRMEIEEDRTRIADQNGRIATIEGIGEGLGAFVMLLQIFNIMQNAKKGVG